VGENGFVAEDSVEGGAAYGELAGGAELVAVVKVEDVLDMMADYGVEGEIVSTDWMGLVELRLQAGGEGQIAGADYAVDGFKEGGFKDGSQLSDVAGPIVLEEAGECSGAEDDGALLVAGADAVEDGLGEGGDVFTAQAEGWNGEADRG
jgi:hypothetical protein